jgi:hypothetical protein
MLREWAPLTALLSQVPQRVQRGIFWDDLNLTCVDALPEFLAIGTNASLVLWFDRGSGHLQKLKCEVAIISVFWFSYQKFRYSTPSAHLKEIIFFFKNT